jgi:hypothetical protein
MEELLAQFPTQENLEQKYRSFIFQPERVSLNSRQTLANLSSQVGGNIADELGTLYPPNDVYYQFRCELKSPLLRVRTLELLRASIPNAVPSIPNDECFFFYYRVDSEGGISPNYEQFTPENIYCIYLYPQGFLTPPTWYVNQNTYGWNTAFPDYDSLVTALNKASQANDVRLGARFIANDISFTYDANLNKITMKGNNIFDESDNMQYFYSPVGWADPNLIPVIAELKASFQNPDDPDNLGTIPIDINTDGYTLNRRLGFTFNGLNIDEPLSLLQTQILRTRILPMTDTDVAYTPANANPNYTAESFCDLVNTGNIFLYADIVGGSTQDTNTEDRLLAVIPASASSLAVVFGESKIPCELTKTSEDIYNITFTMRDDKGKPFYIPTNAYVNLELKVTYR